MILLNISWCFYLGYREGKGADTKGLDSAQWLLEDTHLPCGWENLPGRYHGGLWPPACIPICKSQFWQVYNRPRVHFNWHTKILVLPLHFLLYWVVRDTDVELSVWIDIWHKVSLLFSLTPSRNVTWMVSSKPTRTYCLHFPLDLVQLEFIDYAKNCFLGCVFGVGGVQFGAVILAVIW